MRGGDCDSEGGAFDSPLHHPPDVQPLPPQDAYNVEGDERGDESPIIFFGGHSRRGPHSSVDRLYRDSFDHQQRVGKIVPKRRRARRPYGPKSKKKHLGSNLRAGEAKSGGWSFEVDLGQKRLSNRSDSDTSSVAGVGGATSSGYVFERPQPPPTTLLDMEPIPASGCLQRNGPILGVSPTDALQPPWPMIAPVLVKARREGARLVLVAPQWKTEAWWPLLQRMARKLIVLRGRLYRDRWGHLLPAPRWNTVVADIFPMTKC